MVNERQAITGSNCLNGVLSKVIVDEKGIKNSWKEHMEKWMNEETHTHTTVLLLVWKRMNGIIENWLELKKDQQIVS